jgi:hypothetical protein
MIIKRPMRRMTAALFVIVGAMLMLFAPPIWLGVVTLAVGIALEAIGIAIEHGDRGELRTAPRAERSLR